MADHRRELKNAQAFLIEMTGKFLYGMATVEELTSAWDDYEKVSREMDGRAPASDGDTSETAARSIVPSGLRMQVIRLVTAHHAQFDTGMTTAEMEARLHRSHQSVSSAVNYADEHGWLKDSGDRRRTPSNRPAIVWAPTDKCRAEMLTLALGESLKRSIG